MKKLGLVIGDGTDHFLIDLMPELRKRFVIRGTKHYRMMTPIIKGKKQLFRYKLKRLMLWSDILFFEWADWKLVIASHLKKKAYIVTRLHSYELTDYSHKVNWKNVDKVILTTDAMKERFLSMNKIDEMKVHVIKNVVDIDRFRPLDKKEYIGNLGTLTYIRSVKRLYDLILAFNIIQKELPNLKLYIAGSVDDKEKRYHLAILELIDKLDLKEKVILEGRIDNLEKWFNKIDIYINHSYWEGFSVSLIEAMASGCYPLVHFWKGAEELVPKDNIYIQTSELKDKITEFYNWDDQKRIEFSQMTRARIEVQFREKTQIREIIKLLKSD